jgi:hypothetical protein
LKFETKQILITVKAYPNPSPKYSETVCCAGVDLNNYQWVRLYPIPYRDLDDQKKFKKYSIIEVACAMPRDDKRPESFRVNPNTIKIKENLGPEKNWEKRKSIVLNLPVKSLCQVYKDAEEKDLSLGLIRPERVSFKYTNRTLSDQRGRETCYAQLSFFNKKKKAIEEIPYNFYYQFHCAGEIKCPGHKLLIIDWEIGQAYRDWRSRYPIDKVLLEKIEQRWIDIADVVKKDVYFYVGNMKRFRNIFMVLGVFYPPRKK